MIELFHKLITHISRNTGAKCSFGLRDLAPDEYPHVQIVPDNGITVIPFAANDSALSVTVTLAVIVDRKDELSAFKILTSLLASLRSFDEKEAHIIGETGTTVYAENTFRITVPLSIRYIV